MLLCFPLPVCALPGVQVTARRNGFPLDNMTTETHVSTLTSPDQCSAYPVDGAFVYGLFLEGARWATKDEDGGDLPSEVVGDTPCRGYLQDSKLKELMPALPVVYIKAVTVKAGWTPTSVGYLRGDPRTYECPVYITTFRGPTYVFLATLKSQVDSKKWTLAGVAIIMSEDD